MSITLPNEIAQAVRDKVKAGEYASESEVIRDGLRVLAARDQAVEAWLQLNVAAAYDAMRVNPGRGRCISEVRASFAALHAKRSKWVL